MQHRTRFITMARRLSGLALSALIAAPLATAAWAKPKDGAPAYGYRNGNGKSNGKGKKDKGDYSGRSNRRSDDDSYNNGDGYGYSTGNTGYPDDNIGTRATRVRRTLEGVVTRDLGGNRFEMRVDNGRVLTVRARQTEPNRLSPGDRVRVEGFSRTGREDNRYNTGDARADFVAESLQILANVNDGYYNPGGGNNGNNPGGGYYGGDGSARRVSFPATVLDRDGSRRISVRGDNGRNYTVESRYNIVRVDDGDRVRVEGVSRNGVVTDARVVLLRNSDSPAYDAQKTNFVGHVTRVDERSNLIVVHEDATGRSYTFRTRQAKDFQVNQHVRAYSTITNGRAVITRVVRI